MSIDHVEEIFTSQVGSMVRLFALFKDCFIHWKVEALAITLVAVVFLHEPCLVQLDVWTYWKETTAYKNDRQLAERSGCRSCEIDPPALRTKLTVLKERCGWYVQAWSLRLLSCEAQQGC